jgi:hypothetical protein
VHRRSRLVAVSEQVADAFNLDVIKAKIQAMMKAHEAQ